MSYDLRDIQPGILRSHGRRYTNYLLLNCEISSANHSYFKAWIESIIKDDKIISDFQSQLSNSYYRRFDKEKYEKKAVVTIGFGGNFFEQILGISNKITMHYPEDDIFIEGMFGRRDYSHDYESWSFDNTSDGTGKKVDPFFLDYTLDYFGEKIPKGKKLEIFISLSHQFKGSLRKITKNIIKGVREFTLSYSCEESAVLKNSKKQSLSPLDFVDGVSERKDIGIVIQKTLVEENWISPNGARHFGSYLAFRKIEVNRIEFEKRIQSITSSIVDKNDADFARAMVIGRHQNGAPLINFAKPDEDISLWSDGVQDIPFNFDNDPDGRKCPLHSHVRRMRTGGRAKIVRRGTTYPQTLNKEEVEGLYFVSFQSEMKSLESLFEKIGRKNKKDPADMLLYSPRGTDEKLKEIELPEKWDGKGKIKSRLMGQEVTIFRGGGYFYVPSVSFIRSLV